MVKGRQIGLAAAVLVGLGLAASQAQAACTFGASGEPSLQQSFDSLLGAGQLSASNDCLADGTDAQWTTSSLYSGATVVLELAGNAGTNIFGVYDLNNPNNRIDIFQGIDGAGDSALIQLTGSPGNYSVTVTEDQTQRALNLTGSSFGFYLQGANGTFFSDSTDNGGGVDYMYAYQGTGDTFVGGPFTIVQTVFRPSDYLLAWEDLPNGDRDFQDFVVLTRSIVPAVPLPPALLVFASGLVGLAGFARRRNATA